MSLEQIETLEAEILEKEGLKEVERLGSGNSGADIIRCKSPDGERVVKIPTDEKSLNEILSNAKGYVGMIRLGLRENLPNHLKVRMHRGTPYIVMSYLGSSFAEESSRHYTAGVGISLYQVLCDSLEKVYRKSVRRDDQGHAYLSMVEQKIIAKFENHLIPAGLSDEGYVGKLKAIKMADRAPLYNCFSPYDFTPEDVFLIGGTIVYPDPKKELRGLPQISLACFAGVARDAYNLPDSFNGYKVIERFALEAVPDIIHISNELAGYLFTFGRVLQCAISSQVRIGKEQLKAKYFAEMSMGFIDTLYSAIRGESG